MRAEPLVIVAILILAMPGGASRTAAGGPEDLAEARRLFEANLEAIRNRDRDAYLSTYLDSESMARTGPGGTDLGFQDHAAQVTAGSWPDVFEAYDLRLVPLREGLVYGTYRYRVRYGDRELMGLSERVIVKTEAGWKIAVTSAFDSPPEIRPPARALVGATLVDGTGADPIPDAVVVMRDGRIECAGTRASCSVPDGVDALDISGMWLTPGLIDAHVHFSQTGWADGRPDALDLRGQFPYENAQAALKSDPERWFRSYLCSGVTAVFDVGGYAWTWGLRELAANDSMSPHVAAAGPLLSTWDFWLNLPGERQFIYLSDPEAARQAVRYLVTQKSDAAKLWFIPVADRDYEEMADTVRAAAKEAHQLRLPLIVHATGLREARLAVEAGAKMLVHSIWAQAVDDEFRRLARTRQVVYCPTLTVADGYRRLFESIASGVAPVPDDPGGCTDPVTRARLAITAVEGANVLDREAASARAARNEERERIMAENLKRVQEAGIVVAMGTDAGNPLTLHGSSVYAEMEAMQAAGLSPMQVLVASTQGGARALHRRGDLGTVRQGAIADLLVVAADPTKDISGMRQIRLVIRGGVVRSVEELRHP